MQAQTNTFPASGNIGIGTLNPSAALDVTSNVTYGNAPFVRISNYVRYLK